MTADDTNSKAKLSKKFGAEPSLWKELVDECRRLELNLYGVAFHVGSQDSWSFQNKWSFLSFTRGSYHEKVRQRTTIQTVS